LINDWNLRQWCSVGRDRAGANTAPNPGNRWEAGGERKELEEERRRDDPDDDQPEPIDTR
jgi:hypothetical protein